MYSTLDGYIAQTMLRLILGLLQVFDVLAMQEDEELAEMLFKCAMLPSNVHFSSTVDPRLSEPLWPTSTKNLFG